MRGLTYAPEAGIFSTFVDGLEACSLEEVSSAEPFIPQGAVGKIVSGGWYFIAETPETDKLRRGMSVTLSLPDEVSATVISAENGKAVLRCRDGLEDVVNTRRAAFRITVSEAQGIKIPDKALHRHVCVCSARRHRRALQGRYPAHRRRIRSCPRGRDTRRHADNYRQLLDS